MRHAVRRIFSGDAGNLRGKITWIYLVLIAANLGAWAWAILAFRDYPVLLGTALLAYGFGLRHAVDADHIAAIDNVTRKLMQDGKRPVTVGFFFSLGHSTVVVLASIAIAATATAFNGRLIALHQFGSAVGTLASAGFLLIIAIMNCVILATVYHTFRRVKAGGRYVDEDLNALLAGRGLLARLFRPMFRLIHRSWHMYPLGFLFGLGFDTATEIGLLGISAAQASQGMPIWSILVFPALFTAGMSLIDTTDSVLMLSLRQADPQAVLQHDDHLRVRRRRPAGGRNRGAGPDRPAVRSARPVLGQHRCAERQFRHDRLFDHRPVRRVLAGLRHRLSGTRLRPA